MLETDASKRGTRNAECGSKAPQSDSAFRLCFACALAVSLTLFTPTRAQTEETTPTPPPPESSKLASSFYQQKVPIVGEITRGIVTAETNQFSFILPTGFRKEAEAGGKKLSLISGNYACTLSVDIHESATQGRAELKPEALRSLVLSRHPKAVLVNEFNAAIESMSGPAFEVEWPSPTDDRMITRTAFVPYPGGHLEINLQTSAKEVRKYDQTLNQFLLSFRSSPLGTKLAVQEFLTDP